MRGKLGTGYSSCEAGLSGFKSDPSLGLSAESELGLGLPSFGMEDLRKRFGWNAGGAKDTFCQDKNSTFVLLCKG